MGTGVRPGEARPAPSPMPQSADHPDRRALTSFHTGEVRDQTRAARTKPASLWILSQFIGPLVIDLGPPITGVNLMKAGTRRQGNGGRPVLGSQHDPPPWNNQFADPWGNVPTGSHFNNGTAPKSSGVSTCKTNLWNMSLHPVKVRGVPKKVTATTDGMPN